MAVQKEIKARNDELPENGRMLFRIDINLGDVIQEEERINGDGVNIAARLEGLSEPGGICISKTAFDHIENKLPYGYEFLGDRAVKNIAKPIAAYRVLMDPRVTVAGEKEKKKIVPFGWRKALDLEGESIEFPILYFDFRMISGTFTAKTKKLKKLLPHPNFKPIEIFPGTGMMIIVAFEYRDTSIGPCNEIGLSVPVKFPPGFVFPGLSAISMMLNNRFSVYIGSAKKLKYGCLPEKKSVMQVRHGCTI